MISLLSVQLARCLVAAQQGPEGDIDWSVVARTSLRHGGNPLANKSLFPKGTRVHYYKPAIPVESLPGGKIRWVVAEPKSPDDEPDGSRILYWREHGKLKARPLDAGAAPMKFDYGDGVLWGSARVVGKWLIVAGARLGQSPFCHGGIEVWERRGEDWEGSVQKTTEHEVEKYPRFVGRSGDVRFELKNYTTAILMAHGGADHIFEEGIFRFRGGHYPIYSERHIPSALRTADELLLAVQSKKLHFGKASKQAWATANRWRGQDWEIEDSHKFKGGASFDLIPNRRDSKWGLRIRVLRRGASYWVSSVRRIKFYRS